MRDDDCAGAGRILRRTITAPVVADDHDANTRKILCCSYGGSDSSFLVLCRDDARDTGQVGGHPPRLVRQGAVPGAVLGIGNLTVMSVETVIASGVRSEVG